MHEVCDRYLFLFLYLGTPLQRSPVLGHRDLDLYKLFKIVSKMNGMDKVCDLVYVCVSCCEIVMTIKCSSMTERIQM